MLKRIGFAVLLVITLLLGIVLYAQETHSDTLPLLSDDRLIAITYSDTLPEARTTLDMAFGETIEAGVNAYQLSVHWSDLEPQPNNIDTSYLESLLQILQTVDMTPYLVIRTIDTNNLTLPSDLVRTQQSLRHGLSFDDEEMLNRFGALLDEVIPLLSEYDGFYVAVGNEVDVWLTANPNQEQAFENFVAFSRDHIKQINPQMGVGANITYMGIQAGFDPTTLLNLSDAASYSYYPIESNFEPMPPDAIPDHLSNMIAISGNLPILIQETGYPSGYYPDPTYNSSGDWQRQYVEAMFDGIEMYPQIRFVSFLHLADWTDADCDTFAQYYGVGAPAFREFLCSLGFHTADGNPKPAFDAFLERLLQMN